MSEVWEHTDSSFRSPDANAPPQQARRTSISNGSDKDMEVGSVAVSVSIAGSASVRRNAAMIPFSMVPDDDDDTESESTSSFEGSEDDDGDAGASHSIRSSGGGGGGGNGLPHKSGGADSTALCLKNTDSWRSDSRASDEEGVEYRTGAKEACGNTTEKKEGVYFQQCSPLVDTANTFLPLQGRFRLWDFPRLFFRILFFCDCYTVCSAMLVCRRFHQIATHDTVWRNILNSMNLQPLLELPKTPTQDYYQYFLEEVITTRALHGQYLFRAVSPEEKWYDIEGTGGKGSAKKNAPQHSPIFDDSHYPISMAMLLISPASLGQMNHPIGRMQLLIEYKDKRKENIEGIARFSWHRRCFVFCCSSNVPGVRGQVFTVAISTARKPWYNQSMEQFEAHKGGLRFIMTPVLLEGAIPGSRITEMDVVSVSCPRT
ncbi:hypothetical protein TCDM_08277 [Trypanosoma cruzi Dm28c]|uniref:F-box domain-containing protein n=2 Tax=Trypanosoma cruzi TaxID=5693 RepID=V5ASL2_TRYCR|nr:hypothetical protein TCDM_08277 [Trypanosoma cruzi Dm28c]PBJ67842.1 hypothetical protein BCY84_22814 [Trypanosoma cruzi cruzi]PWU87117.1 hypothetical protein C4B63_101g27 [Trypanosoma cruzi]